MKKLILATMLVSMFLTTHTTYSAHSAQGESTKDLQSQLKGLYIELCKGRKTIAEEVMDRKSRGITATTLIIGLANHEGMNPEALADLTLVVVKGYSTTKSKSEFADEIYNDCIKEKLQ